MKRICGGRRGAAQRGLSLVEVMIAVVVLALLTVSVVSTLVFSSASTRLNTNSITAKNIAQGYFEMMAIDEFADINATNYPDIPFPAEPFNLADPNAVWIDRALLIPCAVDFEFKGFGVAESGGSSSLTDDNQSWTADEWAGDTVFIIEGQGAGQYAQIASNTATTLNFATTLSFAPASNSRYMINNGKTVEVTTRWRFQGQDYQQTIESLIINYRNDEDLGF